ncbi:hypothetical protein ACQEU6_04350 [Spirillospora sp. CA-108201]
MIRLYGTGVNSEASGGKNSSLDVPALLFAQAEDDLPGEKQVAAGQVLPIGHAAPPVAARTAMADRSASSSR